MGDQLPTPPEQVLAELPVIYYPPPLPVERTWREKLAAWVPRFSLLNLLFLTLLIGLAASFISLKASSKQQVAELERKIERINRLNDRDRRVFEEYSKFPHPTRVGAIRLLPRTNHARESNKYELLLILDPAKNYVVELMASTSANEELSRVIQTAYVRALSEDAETRCQLKLEVNFFGDNPVDGVNPKKPFVGNLDFLLRWQGWLPSGFDILSQAESLGKTPRIEMYKNQGTEDFSSRFVYPEKLNVAAELARFKWYDAQQAVETYSILIREVSARELPPMSPKRYLFIAPSIKN